MSFSDLGLSPKLLSAVEEAGYVTPTPIQARAIPVILEGRDVLGLAQTGTGKTASFCLPMIDLLASGRARARMPRSLIISPVRELATQTAEYFDVYGKHTKLTKALLIGGVGLGEQEKTLERGVDVLVATPGRLLDQFERGNILLGGVEILVIDEADRMLDMGFIPDVERIVGLLTKRKQTLLFSATMPKEVRRLAETFLNNPVEIQISPPATTAEGVDDAFVSVVGDDKEKMLRRLIAREGIEKALIFCNRKRSVSALKRKLAKAGLRVSDIHGDLDQTERQQTLEAFKRGDLDYLVATDVAARGLDISQLPNVINFDVPINPDDYIHRIGRTGRAGRKGRAFTLMTGDDAKFVAAIAKHTGRAVRTLAPDGDEPVKLAPSIAAEAPAEAPPTEVKPAFKKRGRKARDEAEAPSEAAPSETGAPLAAEAKPARATRRRRPAAVEAAPAPQDQPTADASVPLEPVRPEPVLEATPEPVTEPAPEAPPPPRPARSRATRKTAPPAPSPSAAPEPAAGRAPKIDTRRKPGRPQSDEPIIGLGDHVPSFLLRPVPLRPAPTRDDP